MSRREEVEEEKHNKGGVSKTRRKRQAEDSAFVKNFYVEVMNDVNVKYNSGELSSDQTAAATAWIQETQNLLGMKNFEVLGLEVGDKSTVEMLVRTLDGTHTGYQLGKSAAGNRLSKQTNDTAMTDE